MSHGHPDAGGDSDVFHVSKIVSVGVVAIFIFAVSVLVAYWLLVDKTRILGDQGAAAQPAPLENPARVMEVGIVNQAMFQLDQRFMEKRKDKQARLDSYGWSDKERRLAHIPIDKAMELFAAGAPVVPPIGTQAAIAAGTLPAAPAPLSPTGVPEAGAQAPAPEARAPAHGAKPAAPGARVPAPGAAATRPKTVAPGALPPGGVTP